MGTVGSTAEKRPTPEQLLQQLESEEEHQATGRLKIFLGYASGVGKSFRMLDEGRRRHERGQDVVVGAMQSVVTADLQAIVSSLEVIPLKTVSGALVMDMQTILARSPKVCLVDGLAHDNPSGSKHSKRWEDVAELLAHGIAVITSVNLQHIEEKHERVSGITGKTVTETVPLSFLNKADEIVVVDAPPETCVITSSDGTRSRMTQHQLSELREIALLLAADVVDEQLERYLARHGIEQSWGTQERILVIISPRTNAQRMLGSGVRNRDRFHGELITAHFNRPDWSKEQRQTVETGLEIAKECGSEIVELDGEDTADTILQFARLRGITQIYIGHKGRENWYERAFGSSLEKLIRSAEGIDVRVFPHT
jgi:two-component system sensor histidine kinase KdpD